MDMLIELKALKYVQPTASMQQNNQHLLYYCCIRYFISNIFIFSTLLSLNHGLSKDLRTSVVHCGLCEKSHYICHPNIYMLVPQQMEDHPAIAKLTKLP